MTDINLNGVFAKLLSITLPTKLLTTKLPVFSNVFFIYSSFVTACDGSK